MGAQYYTEAFSPMAGRCFRMVTRASDVGPIHCPERAAWQGSFRARGGRRYMVESCEGHCDPLADRCRL
jgi:hypothetical protein